MEAPEKIVDLDNFVITASEASSFKLWPEGPLAPSPEPNSIQMFYNIQLCSLTTQRCTKVQLFAWISVSKSVLNLLWGPVSPSDVERVEQSETGKSS